MMKLLAVLLTFVASKPVRRLANNTNGTNGTTTTPKSPTTTPKSPTTTPKSPTTTQVPSSGTTTVAVNATIVPGGNSSVEVPVRFTVSLGNNTAAGLIDLYSKNTAIQNAFIAGFIEGMKHVGLILRTSDVAVTFKLARRRSLSSSDETVTIIATYTVKNISKNGVEMVTAKIQDADSFKKIASQIEAAVKAAAKTAGLPSDQKFDVTPPQVNTPQVTSSAWAPATLAGTLLFVTVAL